MKCKQCDDRGWLWVKGAKALDDIIEDVQVVCSCMLAKILSGPTFKDIASIL